MEMIAMLGGLGQSGEMTQEEREVAQTVRDVTARVQREQEVEVKAFWKMVGVFALGAATGWVARGYIDRASR